MIHTAIAGEAPSSRAMVGSATLAIAPSRTAIASASQYTSAGRISASTRLSAKNWAMTNPQATLEAMTESNWDDMFATNLKGMLFSIQACLPHLKKSAAGRVVLTSSLAAVYAKHKSRKLFVERGYAGTRLEDVAASAGISKGTLYLYFANKEELFKAVITEAIAGPLAVATEMIDQIGRAHV